LVGDELYMVSDNGMASCLDAKTGTVHWSERLGGAFSASPVYADGRIYLQTEDGVGIVLKSGNKFEELTRNAMEERTLASYAFGEGPLFLRRAEHVYRIQAKGTAGDVKSRNRGWGAGSPPRTRKSAAGAPRSPARPLPSRPAGRRGWPGSSCSRSSGGGT